MDLVEALRNAQHPRTRKRILAKGAGLMAIDFFFDIETVPDQSPDAFAEHVGNVKPPGNYKKQETIDQWLFDNAERIATEEWKKTALNGLRGEIVSIAWAIDNRDPQSLT